MAATQALCFLDASQISSLLSYPLLIQHLRKAFSDAASVAAPPRHHHRLPSPDSTLLLMPAWPISPSSSTCPYMGVKLVTVFPHNATVGLPSVSASYLLSSSLTGLPLAFLDGREITLWRTACVSALAAHYLARPDAQVLLMVGAGAMAPHLIKAHCAAFPSIREILIWNRTQSRAESLARALQDEMATKAVQACSDLEGAARAADLISCATLSEQPIVRGSWLTPGTHLDLVGSFAPSMRECDEDAIKQGMVYVDTEAACQEAGELAGVTGLQGTLSQLATGEKQGRQHVHDITIFKSVGCALVDLATAQLVYEEHQLIR